MGFIGITNYKIKSSRLPNKNQKVFYDGKTLAEIKIGQLIQSGAMHVYVSTNDTNVKNTDMVTFIHRDEKFCTDDINFGYVMKEIFNSIPVDDAQDAIYTINCTPLFWRYDELYDRYQSAKKNQIAVHPVRHYYFNSQKQPINFMCGLWHSPTENMMPIYSFPNTGTACKMKDFREVNYQIPIEFDFFEITHIESIDIDFQGDFELAQILYEKEQLKNNH